MPFALLAMYAVCGVTVFLQPQEHLSDATWPTHATITVPQGWIQPADQLLLLENGQPIVSQIETVARWPDGSPKWLHAYASFRYVGGKPARYELEKRAKLPAGMPRSPLTVSDKAGGITINTGAITLFVPRPFAGVTRVEQDGKTVVDGPGGPSLVDERGIVWHAMHDDRAEIVVEQQGPAQVTIRASGWYQTAERRVEPFCRFVTRITAFAGSAMIRFDHATIFADDMRKHAVAELAFKFAIPGAKGFASGPLKGAFGDSLSAAWLAQLSANRLLEVAETGTDHAPQAKITGKHRRSAGWFGAELDDRRVVLLTKDFWEKCPKEVKIGRDELVYYAWPRHGELAERDEAALRPEGVYKFQCFQTGKLLDSRLPNEYFTALEAQTDTTECKAVYARAANLEGVAVHNEFALTFVPDAASGGRTDAPIERLERLYVEDPIARVSPAAVAASGVFGPVAASGPEFRAVHKAVRDGMLGLCPFDREVRRLWLGHLRQHASCRVDEPRGRRRAGG